MSEQGSRNVTRWTAGGVTADEAGGFVAYGDYLALKAMLAALKQRIAELEAECDHWKELEREAAEYVEAPICMRTHFTGDPPYVGWRGLGLALGETLDERDALQARLNAVEAENEAYDETVKIWAKSNAELEAERDAALSRIAELEAKPAEGEKP